MLTSLKHAYASHPVYGDKGLKLPFGSKLVAITPEGVKHEWGYIDWVLHNARDLESKLDPFTLESIHSDTRRGSRKEVTSRNPWTVLKILHDALVPTT